MFNWIIYRTFEHFNKKDVSMAISNTVNFMVLLQASLLVPLMLIINFITILDPQITGIDNRIKYCIGVPFAIILIILNSYWIKRRLKSEKLNDLRNKFQKKKYKIPIWIIFSIPVLFVIVCPIIYGIINGTLSFPFLER
jgi:amino acid permease